MPAVNFANRTLFHGDNLAFLRGMNSGTVHLIATDPPFNKGRDFHATPDSLASGARFQDRWSWDDDVHPEWIDQIEDDWPHVMEVINGSRASYGDDMGAFLCFMGVRLLEMRRVLREDGSIYLHCDPTASHYLKELMDAIFGRKNFRNEIVWHYQTSSGKPQRHFIKNSDNLLFYSRVIGRNIFNILKDPWPETTLRKWQRDRKGIYRTNNGKKYYIDPDGKRIDNVWKFTLSSRSRERTGYPTQKPLALYERIIKASSNEGDWVLDPFAGCATTCIAAERLGRQWVGIDIWDKAHGTVVERLQGEGLAAPAGDTGGRLLTFGQIGYSTAPPVRTDDGEAAAPFLKTKLRFEPPGPRMSRAEMMALLIENSGPVCAGCDRQFDDERYLQLDHNTPRSQGGLNHISNRMLLCGPCNRAKSNTLTLGGLRRLNRKNGWMAAGQRPSGG